MAKAAAPGAPAADLFFGVLESGWGAAFRRIVVHAKGRGHKDGSRARRSSLGLAADGTVFVADASNNRIQYSTPAGLFMGAFGTVGAGNGELSRPVDIGHAPSSSRVYVGDYGNDRMRYFEQANPAVEPGSLGEVKVLFR